MEKNNQYLLLSSVSLLLFLLSIESAYRFTAPELAKQHRFGNCAVLVLGYPSQEDGRLATAQQKRVELGVSSYRAWQCQGIVFSGGAVLNQYIEAEAMANYARQLGVAEQHIMIEGRSRNTWENVGCSLPYLKNYAAILIASDLLHAKRAKRYLCRQQPALCPHTELLGSPQLLYLSWLTISSAVYEFVAWFRDLLLYEGGARENSAVCPLTPEH